MLKIFKFELKYWFKNPTFYVFLGLFFLISVLFAAISGGIFESLTGSNVSTRIVNSPVGINDIFNGISIFIWFLIPSVIGASVYRDFKSNMHSILFSYPFTKAQYLFGKFLSSLFVVSLIILGIMLGIMLGFKLPGTNEQILTSFNIVPYLKAYFVFIIPNVLFIGAIVFGVVTFTRNIAAGFIAIILFLFIGDIIEIIFDQDKDILYRSLLNPFGGEALYYYTKKWTLAERNVNPIPIQEILIYNRLIWIGVSTILFSLIYKFFQFHQNAISFSFKKNEGERFVKQNFGNIINIELPKVTFDYSFLYNLKASWKFSNMDLKYIIRSWPFIIIAGVGVLFLVISSTTFGEIFGTNTYPRTWQMLLIPGTIFTFFLMIITFLYSGLLIHRSRTSGINVIEDCTTIPNWTLILSKFIALLKMQALLFLVVIISGISIQTYRGYYDYEIGHYLFDIYILQFASVVIWTFLAFFIQTLFKNTYIGFFVLLVLYIGIPYLSAIGIEQSIFKYNQGPGYRYSDMNGYGAFLSPFFIYKAYWTILGLALFILSITLWTRGITFSIKERLSIAKKRFNPKTAISFGVLIIAFFSLGFKIYHENNIKNKRYTQKDRELQRVEWEKKYRKYSSFLQPKIVAVDVDMQIFPKERNFKAIGEYTLVNKTDKPIDSILLNHNDYPSKFEFSKENNLVSEDTVFHFDIYRFKTPMQPNDTLKFTFEIENKEHTALRTSSPIIENGTFFHNTHFPSIGYPDGQELRDDGIREKYGLPKNDLRPHPSDSTALGNTYIAKDADWIDFQATVSTSMDQIAIAPGYLQKEWEKDGRRYFQYKMDSKILNFYAFNSARYEVVKENWNDINLEIYYHKGHDYNLDRMMKGLKESLKYNSENFSPYQHKQARIIEFPLTEGSFAQSFPNTIPYSESVGFIAEVNDEDNEALDYPYAITAHEVAHQWWAHQVIGADVLGATMLSESLSEYVSLKVLEKGYDKQKMQVFLKDALDKYTTSRTFETKREKPLMYNDGQGYVRYQKGSLVFYALSDYIGEEKLNNTLKEYVEKVKFQTAPYTTSEEMVSYIEKVTPDSLKYVIDDMFRTVTLYRNKIISVETEELENGKFKVDIEFEVAKSRYNDKGKVYYNLQEGDTLSYQKEGRKKPLYSAPLADYIEIGIFGEEEKDGKTKEKELYLKKHKITEIHNKVSIIVDEKPKEVGVDPYYKLIDRNSNDNRKDI
ncbi:ABC transporter permease/M1 family aminopeptidase [Aureivirga sp. CE67]|uniref:ABC transporter permease/M1 family aminopeptidase n=1 Tax=Aureivirga sp. CE67 TaxID=1788983 RepID=UPI0018CAC840|nr:M1 family aminopeptidase [Aureivirga sp. CE67]